MGDVRRLKRHQGSLSTQGKGSPVASSNPILSGVQPVSRLMRRLLEPKPRKGEDSGKPATEGGREEQKENQGMKKRREHGRGRGRGGREGRVRKCYND